MSKKNRKTQGLEDAPARGKKSKKDKASYKELAEADRSIPKVVKPAREPIHYKTEKQRLYMESIRHNILTLATGPAGTGKTFVGCAMACDLLMANQIETIIISRPATTAEEEWGALPGDLDEKYAPYLEPYWESFHKRMGQKTTDYFIKQGRIIAAPLGFMRGRTFDDCWVFLDEAQNATKKQMELFLTRTGENCRLIVSGDLHQCDLPRNKASGLRDAMLRFKKNKNTGIIEFEQKDVVRSGFAKEVVEAYAIDLDNPKGDRREQ